MPAVGRCSRRRHAVGCRRGRSSRTAGNADGRANAVGRRSAGRAASRRPVGLRTARTGAAGSGRPAGAGAGHGVCTGAHALGARDVRCGCRGRCGAYEGPAQMAVEAQGGSPGAGRSRRAKGWCGRCDPQVRMPRQAGGVRRGTVDRVATTALFNAGASVYSRPDSKFAPLNPRAAHSARRVRVASFKFAAS